MIYFLVNPPPNVYQLVIDDILQNYFHHSAEESVSLIPDKKTFKAKSGAINKEII